MLGDISRVQSIRLVTGYTDMRKSINGLMAIIRNDFKMILMPMLYIFSAEEKRTG